MCMSTPALIPSRTASRKVGDVLVHLDHALEIHPIGDEHALESPVVPQDLGEQVLGGVNRDTVHRPAVDHDRLRAGRDTGLERREVFLPELPAWNVGGASVVPVFGFGVADEVFRRRTDGRLAVLLVFHSTDHRVDHQRSEIRVLTEPLVEPTPARVALEVRHGGEVPVCADGRDRLAGGSTDLLDQLRIPRRPESGVVGRQ